MLLLAVFSGGKELNGIQTLVPQVSVHKKQLKKQKPYTKVPLLTYVEPMMHGVIEF